MATKLLCLAFFGRPTLKSGTYAKRLSTSVNSTGENLEQRCWLASGRYGPVTYSQEYDQMRMVMHTTDAPPVCVSAHDQVNAQVRAASRPIMGRDPRNPDRLATFYR